MPSLCTRYRFVLAMGTAMALCSMASAHPGHEELPAETEAALTQPQNQGGQGRAPMEAIELPEPEVSITIEDGMRVIRSNGLPDHETGAFPNSGNPNAIRPQSHEYKVPLLPRLADEPTIARPEFGIAINGVIFDAGTGEFWSAEGRVFGGGSEWNYDAMGGGVPFGIDENNAHVQPTGKYHYHGLPTGLIENLSGDAGPEQMILLGWAFDGFPIYGPYSYADAWDADSQIKELDTSYRLKKGKRPETPDGPGGTYDGTFAYDFEYVEGSGDLDECNGRFGVTPEFPMGTYYYVISDAFPNVPRLWKGEPSEALARRGGPGGPQGGQEDPGARERPRPGQERRTRPNRGQRPGN